MLDLIINHTQRFLLWYWVIWFIYSVSPWFIFVPPGHFKDTKNSLWCMMSEMQWVIFQSIISIGHAYFRISIGFNFQYLFVLYAGLCYGKLEAGVLTFVIPTLLLGHLVWFMFARSQFLIGNFIDEWLRSYLITIWLFFFKKKFVLVFLSFLYPEFYFIIFF